MAQTPPTLGQQQYDGKAGRLRRPPTVIVAVILMVPVFVTWLVAGVAWLVVVARTPGDTGRIFWWILGALIFALCLFVAYMSAVGAVQAWRGHSTKMKIPAGFTVALFVIALINLFVHGRISYSPSQIVPLVVGAMAGAALVLIGSRSATAWFAQLH